ncbi:hypothetical protein C1646_770757 [Rhizophagus diaphanus]|nr:hypothetical protein C1646_770757 [Rhizophagus diaphanus] [Rhizophagus sp. MUCL 43196]
MTKLNCKYLLDICYLCQKYLYCFELLQQEPYSLFSKVNKYLFDANDKFGYNSNFEKSFSYTFCSTCNSQIQRYRNADKKIQQTQIKENDNKVAPSNLLNKKEVENIDKKENHQIFSLISSDIKEGVDVDDIKIDDDEDSNLEEIKVQIIVKSKNKKKII